MSLIGPNFWNEFMQGLFGGIQLRREREDRARQQAEAAADRVLNQQRMTLALEEQKRRAKLESQQDVEDALPLGVYAQRKGKMPRMGVDPTQPVGAIRRSGTDPDSLLTSPEEEARKQIEGARFASGLPGAPQIDISSPLRTLFPDLPLPSETIPAPPSALPAPEQEGAPAAVGLLERPKPVYLPSGAQQQVAAQAQQRMLHYWTRPEVVARLRAGDQAVVQAYLKDHELVFGIQAPTVQTQEMRPVTGPVVTAPAPGYRSTTLQQTTQAPTGRTMTTLDLPPEPTQTLVIVDNNTGKIVNQTQVPHGSTIREVTPPKPDKPVREAIFDADGNFLRYVDLPPGTTPHFLQRPPEGFAVEPSETTSGARYRIVRGPRGRQAILDTRTKLLLSVADAQERARREEDTELAHLVGITIPEKKSPQLRQAESSLARTQDALNKARSAWEAIPKSDGYAKEQARRKFDALQIAAARQLQAVESLRGTRKAIYGTEPSVPGAGVVRPAKTVKGAGGPVYLTRSSGRLTRAQVQSAVDAMKAQGMTKEQIRKELFDDGVPPGDFGY